MLKKNGKEQKKSNKQRIEDDVKQYERIKKRELKKTEKKKNRKKNQMKKMKNKIGEETK